MRKERQSTIYEQHSSSSNGSEKDEVSPLSPPPKPIPQSPSNKEVR